MLDQYQFMFPIIVGKITGELLTLAGRRQISAVSWGCGISAKSLMCYVSHAKMFASPSKTSTLGTNLVSKGCAKNARHPAGSWHWGWQVAVPIPVHEANWDRSCVSLMAAIIVGGVTT